MEKHSPLRHADGTFINREAWLTALGDILVDWITDNTDLEPKPFKVSCGFPSRGGLGVRRRSVGQCWSGVDREVAEIFISPTLENPFEVSHTLLHEILHAFLPPGVGHRKPFSQAAKAVGLRKPWFATTPGPELSEWLGGAIRILGVYPHEEIKAAGKGQKGRNLKFMCPSCKWTGRSTAFWLDSLGAPVCRECGITMIHGDELAALEQGKGFQGTLLKMAEQITEYNFPGSDRFVLRQERNSRGHQRWLVIDFEPDESSFFQTVTARTNPAESREDAIALATGLLSGDVTYKMLDVKDDEIDDRDDEYLDDDEDEPDDNEEDDVILFPHEQERKVA